MEYKVEINLNGPDGNAFALMRKAKYLGVKLDLSKDDHKITKSGTYTITCTGGSEGSSHTVRIVNSGTSNVSFSNYFLFPSGGTPALPTASGAISMISFTVHRAGAVGINTQLLAGASVNFS